MKGAGHFAFGFLLAYAILLWALQCWPGHWLRLYGPFLPFATGAYAALPYLLQTLGWTGEAAPSGVLWNVFLFYPSIEHVPGLSRLLSEFHVSAGLVALAYCHLVSRYIKLVKRAGKQHAQ